MQNRALKAQLIEDGIFKQYGKKQHELYTQYQGDIDAVQQELKEIYGENETALKQLKNARKMQNKRIRKHYDFFKYMNYELYFITLTISDKKRKKPLSESTFIEYCQRGLKDTEDYILNKDYGGKKGRLHAHAIAAVKPGTDIYNLPAFKEYRNKIGATNIKRIGSSDKDQAKITRYITKLCLHALKVKQNRIHTKKGSLYQKYQYAEKRVREEQKRYKEESNRYLYIQQAIEKNPDIREIYIEITEQAEQNEIAK